MTNYELPHIIVLWFWQVVPSPDSILVSENFPFHTSTNTEATMLRNGFFWLNRLVSIQPTHSLIPSRYLQVTRKAASAGSIFGDVTSHKPTIQADSDKSLNPIEMHPAEDKLLQERYAGEAAAEQETREKYISAQKRRLFDLNVAKNGFYKNNQIFYDHEKNKHYKLSLTDAEIEVLEPSVYIQSFRIHSSVKKATLVNRFVRGYNVKNAINQLHFIPKKMALELEKLLKTGLKLATAQGLDEDQLYIHALWAGSDGDTQKRIEWKGRGRVGLLQSRNVHLKAIFKTQQTRDRLAWEKEQKLNKKNPKLFLNNEPLNFKVRGIYKW